MYYDIDISVIICKYWICSFCVFFAADG